MKETFMLLGSILWLHGTLMAQQTATVTVKLDEIKNAGEGQMVFMLFDQEEGFPREKQKAKYIATVAEVDNQVVHAFNEIPYGNYAICVFHDVNGNGDIDTNFMGMPKEPVAASNMTGFGRPSFKKCTVAIDKQTHVFTLNFIND